MNETKKTTLQKSNPWLGILPFIGIILFIIASCPLLSGSHPDWRHQLLINGITYMIGWAGIGTGISHVFFGNKISKSIGFEQNEFETEVGFISLSLGVVALLASNHSTQYWLALILVSSIYRIACGFLHVQQIIKHKNYAINNTVILVINFVVPAFLLLAYRAWV
jgi:hypothetical protein